MTISPEYTKLATTIRHLKNPNVQTGTLLIELPADVGRAYSGYKRGGIIEGTEKFRKEVLSAIVWLFGIPLINTIGNFACEKIWKIPMNIDYSNAKDGRDCIKDSLNYLKTGITPDGLDVSDLKKYVGKVNVDDVTKMSKKIKSSKQVVSVIAWIANCVAMGIILPKYNQYLTKKKLQKEKAKKIEFEKTFVSMDEFKKNTKENKTEKVSFTGLNLSNVADWFTYGINTKNRFRLISTDVPMIIGRCATARNKYEALEIALMDSAAIYFYNYCLEHSENLLRKIISTPNIGSTVAEEIAKIDSKKLKKIIDTLDENPSIQIKEIFSEETARKIYNQATNGRYSKINKFVKDEELKSIDKSVVEFLKHIKEKEILNSETIDFEKATKAIKALVKKTNIKNGMFFAVGTIASFLGLGILIPKVAYAITKLITGKEGFIALDDEDKKLC